MEKDRTYLEFYKELDLKDYIQILLKRKRIIFVFVLAFGFVTGARVFTATPMYQTSARILIKSRMPQIATLEEVYKIPTWTDDYYHGQIRMLRSSSLAERVVDKLNLKASPRFGAGAVGKLLSMIDVKGTEKSRVVNISVKSDNPQLAATIANTWVEEYVKLDAEDRISATKYAVEWLNKETEQLRLNVEESEKKLQEYMEKHDLVSLERDQDIVTQKLSQINTQATKAKTERLEAETKYKQIEEVKNKGGNLETIPSVRDNSLIKELKANYTIKKAKLSELLGRYKEKHPTIFELKSELKSLEDMINVEIDKVVSSIETEYEEAKANEEATLLALAEQEKKSLELNRIAIEYNVLKRESNTNRRMYESFLSKMKETDIFGKLEASNIRMVDKARVPSMPIEPKKGRETSRALITGLILGIVAALVLEYLDDSIKSQKDIEAYIQLPFLGYVPIIKAKASEVGVYADTHPGSEAAEALRSIRTNINFTFTIPPPHALLITSAIPQEGKTFLTVNLGIIMAQAGSRVVVVDCDIRRPTVHKILGITNSKGIKDYLTNTEDFDSTVQKTSIDNLSVVASGGIPHNPSELLGSSRMELFIKEAKAKFDKIIIDAPPVIAVSDALILSKVVNGAVCIVRGNKTSRTIAFEAKKKLENINTNILGVVLNHIDLRKERYYYTYYHGEKVKKRKKEKLSEAAALLKEEISKPRPEAEAKAVELKEGVVEKVEFPPEAKETKEAELKISKIMAMQKLKRKPKTPRKKRGGAL